MSLATCSDRSSLIYTPYYCEENIWKLCERVQELQCDQLEQCFAVFISNEREMVPIWGQKAGDEEKDHLVVWDYHVILLHRQVMMNGDETTAVYDFDTVLRFPISFDAYCANNFREAAISSAYRYMFRVVPAGVFLQQFASDRSRMRDENGRYLKPPPKYDFIRTERETNNLNSFISMDSSRFPIGQVMGLRELRQMFGSKK